MKRFNWTLAVLTACAILGALPILASCESDGVPAPDSTGGGDYPLCEGKLDGPGCHVSLPGEDAVSSDTKGSQPDTAPPEPQKPTKDYEGEKCPNLGCVLTPSAEFQGDWDCGEPPDFPPDSFVITGLPTTSVPAYCGLPEPTPE